MLSAAKRRRTARPSFAVAQTPLKLLVKSHGLTDGNFYFNDHCVVFDHSTNTSHIFGIFKHNENRRPVQNFAHAVATGTDPGLWDERSFVIPEPDDPRRYALQADARIGEEHIWAPYVVRDEKHKRWVMMYQGSKEQTTEDCRKQTIRMAVSDDLFTWTRVNGTGICFEDVCATRDPFLLPGLEEDEWHIFYTRCDSWESQKSGVAYRTSRDGLRAWSEPKMALVLDAGLQPDIAKSDFSGHSESPHVFHDPEVQDWFLSICSPGFDCEKPAYLKTLLFRSRDGTPFNFAGTKEEADFAVLRSHAGEWVFSNGKRYLTSAGRGQGGIWISHVDVTANADIE